MPPIQFLHQLFTKVDVAAMVMAYQPYPWRWFSGYARIPFAKLVTSSFNSSNSKGTNAWSADSINKSQDDSTQKSPCQDSIKESFKLDKPIDSNCLDVKYSKSGGPGGQNVNKVNTKVDIRFHVDSMEWIPEWVKQRLCQLEKKRINKEGQLVISSTKFRSQKLNLDDAIQKLEDIINKAGEIPKPTAPEKVAKIKKLKHVANEKRLKQKYFHSKKKQDRKSIF
ncbi:Peptidyl-tRNA hydrolase ICT1, mitochondrial [Trichoplax sp. H2]|nr:Peptidyl-tRNA hydrolase ICT1, mitochondrial [Trichoplax sp. H2]|eukprot:RDD39089.1 Peptidyl-tRNA hydrolase ICT1, mitochondrial [Trichoplax sp. H2]